MPSKIRSAFIIALFVSPLFGMPNDDAPRATHAAGPAEGASRARATGAGAPVARFDAETWAQVATVWRPNSVDEFLDRVDKQHPGFSNQFASAVNSPDWPIRLHEVLGKHLPEILEKLKKQGDANGYFLDEALGLLWSGAKGIDPRVEKRVMDEGYNTSRFFPYIGRMVRALAEDPGSIPSRQNRRAWEIVTALLKLDLKHGSSGLMKEHLEKLKRAAFEALGPEMSKRIEWALHEVHQKVCGEISDCPRNIDSYWLQKNSDKALAELFPDFQSGAMERRAAAAVVARTKEAAEASANMALAEAHRAAVLARPDSYWEAEDRGRRRERSGAEAEAYAAYRKRKVAEEERRRLEEERNRPPAPSYSGSTRKRDDTPYGDHDTSVPQPGRIPTRPQPRSESGPYEERRTSPVVAPEREAYSSTAPAANTVTALNGARSALFGGRTYLPSSLNDNGVDQSPTHVGVTSDHRVVFYYPYAGRWLEGIPDGPSPLVGSTPPGQTNDYYYGSYYYSPYMGMQSGAYYAPRRY